MKIMNVNDASFRPYGRVLKEIDFSPIVEALAKTPLTEEVVYVASEPILENLPIKEQLRTAFYGELDIQIGYCNGHNYYLNALEYHRCSEINVAGSDLILLLGKQQDIGGGYTYDTSKAEAFLCPKGCAVELYATTLHYAPCNASSEGFRGCVILPKGTNLPLSCKHSGGEDGLIAAKNKWLIGHAEGGLPDGSHIGLKGINICVK